MKTIVVCHRDPDSSNEFVTFGEPVEIIDIDYGRADLRNADEYKEWANGLLSTATHLILNLRCDGDDAAADAAGDALVHIAKAVTQAAENFGHKEHQ